MHLLRLEHERRAVRRAVGREVAAVNRAVLEEEDAGALLRTE